MNQIEVLAHQEHQISSDRTRAHHIFSNSFRGGMTNSSAKELEFPCKGGQCNSYFGRCISTRVLGLRIALCSLLDYKATSKNETGRQRIMFYENTSNLRLQFNEMQTGSKRIQLLLKQFKLKSRHLILTCSYLF